jgi:putative inorganic carbon (hco3(-)) transporter
MSFAQPALFLPMSVTGSAWVVLAVTFAFMSLQRPVWALALYFLTFFAAPSLWWWGDDLPSIRYALWAGYILLVAVMVVRPPGSPNPPAADKIRTAAVAMAVNAAIVHIVFAVDRTISLEVLVEFCKFLLLYFLISTAIKDRADLHRAIAVIALGGAYIGWEVTINERGDFSGSRLEGVGAPAAQTSNSLANIMLVTLPLAGSLFLQKSWKWRIVAIVASPLILNVLLLCNSRGAFLGLIGTGVSFILVSRGKTRKRALQTMALASVVLFFLLGDPDIMNRFVTTFTGSEERDSSAASRLTFWEAGFRVLNDYPLGAGGGAFKFSLGSQYLSALTGVEDADSRSLHNGFMTEATDWGIQGFLLKMFAFAVALSIGYRTAEKCRREERVMDALLGLCLVTTAIGFLIHCMFGAFLDHEWGYWILALLVRYGALYHEAEGAASVGTSDTTDLRAQPVAAA